MFQLLLPTLFLFLWTFSANAKDWTFLYQEGDIKVYTDHGTPTEFKAEGQLDVDLIDILAVFADIPRRAEWVKHLSESRIIYEKYEEEVLVYSRYDLPWPARDRDSVIESLITKDYKNGELTVRFKDVQDDRAPVIDGIIRVPKTDGSIFIKILSPGHVFIRYQTRLDPGGWLPQWICNYFIKDAPINMLRAMRERIEKTRSDYREFIERQRSAWYRTNP